MALKVIKAERTFDEILSYEPQKLQVLSVENMDRMVAAEQNNTDFKISEVVRNFTGLKEKETLEIENAIERRVLTQLKEIQEKAYEEAYQLGLDEGRKESLEKNNQEIENRLSDLNQLLLSIRNMKEQFLNSNEHHIMKLIYHLAMQITRNEINQYADQILMNVLNESVKLARSDEKIKVHIAESQFDFLSEMQKEASREYDFLKELEVIKDKDVLPGGCIIITNYGEVDAQIEKRIEQLWIALKDTIPPSKDIGKA